MKNITNRIVLLCMAMLLSMGIARAESWDCKTTNSTITPDKPYIELDMRWFEWYTNNSWLKSWKITFSGYSDEFSFDTADDLCSGNSDKSASIRDDNDTYKTYESTNFFVELWNPYTESGDKYNYRVTIRILPKFPIEEDMRIKGTVSAQWYDNHDGPTSHSHSFTAKIDGEGIFQSLGTITRDSDRLKYNNNSLKNVSGSFSGYSRKLAIKVGKSTSSFAIPDGNTSYSTNVTLSSNISDYDVTQTISMENNSFYLGEKTHKVSFIAKKTETLKGVAYPTSLTVEADKWNKTIRLKWSKYSDNLSTSGTWSVIRKDVATETETILGSGLHWGTTSYIDDEIKYGDKYIYIVAFMPNGWDGKVCADLKVTSNEIVVNKDFKIALSTVSSTNSISLSWTHEALGGNWNYSYKIMKSVNDGEWRIIKEERNLSKNVTKYSYKDTNIGSPCDINNYKIEMIALDNEAFDSNTSNAKITGSTEVTSFNASRGDYSNNVRLTWNVNQIGTGATKYKIYRQLLGSNSSKEWKEIYQTEGTYNVYTYDDNTANTGQYYRYKLVAQANCGSGYDQGLDYYSDGFCVTTGVISGRVTYGTGTAVEGVKVSAIKASDDDNSNEQFYSLYINKSGGVVTPLGEDDVKNIFDGNFSVQTWVNLDTIHGSDNMVSEPIIAQMPNLFKFTAKWQDDKYRLYINTYKNSEYEERATDIFVETDKFYHLTYSYDDIAKKMSLYSISNDTIVTNTIDVDYVVGNLVIVDTTIVDKTQKEHLKEFHGKSFVAFGACMQSTTQHYFKGYMDEIRVWNKTMSLEEIKKNYDHVLAGTEKNLKIYYILDEGIIGQEVAYDYSKTDGVPNSLHGSIVVGTKTSTYHSSLLGLHAYTDIEGNYSIRGIPFRGNGTNYNVVPTHGIHEFSPNADARYVSSSSLNFSSVNFEDVSSFPVSGKVYYENTTYPVAGVALYVDGMVAVKDNRPVVTDINGEFTISVPIGDHYITLKRDNHTFENDGRYPADPDGVNTKFTFNKEIKDLTFYDNTKVMYAGRVVGGEVEHAKPLGVGVSEANIGQAKITFSTPHKMNVKRVTEGGAVRYVTNSDTLYYKTDNAPYVNSKAYAGNTDETVNNITILTDPKTGEFAVELPPVEYTVESATILSNDTIMFSELPAFIKPSNDFKDYCDTINVTSVSDDDDDSDTITEQRKFRYRASLYLTHRSTPIFEVSEYENGIFGIDTAYCVEPNGNKTAVIVYELDENNKVKYNYGYPVYETYGGYSYDIRAYERYVNYDGEEPKYDKVPLAGTIVSIHNEFAAGNTLSIEGDTDGEIVELAENEIELDSAGYARYEFKGGAPNIVEPYTLSLNMSYKVNGKHYDWDQNGKFKAIVLGNLPTGNNFITAGPDKVQMILRDPPGSNSYSYWEEGTSQTTINHSGGHYVGGGNVRFDIGLGASLKAAVGVGFYKIIDSEYVNRSVPGIEGCLNILDQDTESYTTTTTDRIATSSDPSLVGAEGDVFIGSSTNVIFGESREVGFHHDKNTNEIVLNMEECTILGEEFTTGFNYTQNYIKSTLIPNTIKLRNDLLLPKGTTVEPKKGEVYYVSNLETTHKNYGTSNKDTDVWGKDVDIKKQTYGDYYCEEGPSYSIYYEKTASAQDQINYYNQSIRNWENILEENERLKIEASKSRNVSVSGGTIVEHTYTTDTIEGDLLSLDFTFQFVNHVEIGAHVSENWGLVLNHDINLGGGGDYYWETENGNINTKGYVIHDSDFTDALSVDICEDGFGAIFRTRGGQTSCPYEGAILSEYYLPGQVLSEATMRVEYPQITADVMTLSNVPYGSAAIFNVKLANISETNTDVWYSLSLVDESNPDGADVTMDGETVTTGRSILIKGGTELPKQIAIKQTDLSILDYENIKLVLSSACQNDPASVYGAVADTLALSVHFVPSCSPIDIHIDNRVLNVNNPKLVVKVNGYDLNYRSLKGINIQIKGEHDNNWTTLKSYVTDETYLTQDVELLKDSEIIYTDSLPSLSEQNYLVRAITLCEYGEETINNESEEILIVKDLSIPALIANPNPTDGILNSGDEVSIVFNEDVKSSEITEVDNIYVKGILNGSAVAHSVAYAANTTSPARTESTIDFGKRSFTVEMWVRYSSEGTILSHGNADNSFTVNVDDFGYVYVVINGNTAKSLQSMPKDKWVYLTITVDQKEGFSDISSLCAYDGNEINLFANEIMTKYEGNGILTLGGMTGAIHEVTLWNYVRKNAESLSNMYTTKSPYTAGLIGYWRLNEGHGTIGTDIVGNRHLIISGTNSWYLENENTAIEIGDKEFISMNVAHCPATDNDNYLIEFWFKGTQKENSVTLLSMNHNDMEIFFNADGNIDVKASSEVFAGSDNNYLDDNWHHMAINVLKATHGTAVVYIDGKNEVQIDADRFPSLAASHLMFGARCYYDKNDKEVYDRFFEGAFDEIRYWKGTYTADYIRNNMYSRVAADEPGLMAYYPMEKMSVDEYNQVVYNPAMEDQSVNAVENPVALVVNKVSDTLTESTPQWTKVTPPLKEAPTYDNVEISYVASERKILINIDEEPKKIEGCTLIFNVSGVRDANNNMMNPVTWSAYVRQNQLNWLKSEVDIRKPSGEEEYFSVRILNTSSELEYWNIQNMPSWLSADIQSGELAPLSSETINFTISSATAIGRYEEVLYLCGNNEIPEPFTVKLVCEGDVPDWNFDPSDFSTSMSMVAQLKINGLVSDNPDDVLAAFIDGECVGKASPVYNKRYDAYYMMMTVWGNSDSDNKQVAFKAYDASSGKLYPIVEPRYASPIVFVSDDVFGDFANPVVLQTSDKMQQSIKLNKGWSWISVNVKLEDSLVENVMEPISENVLYVKSKTAYSVVENGKWHGNLSTIKHSEMYKVQVDAETVLDVIGESAANEPITLNKGWTWIGYNSSMIMSLDDAFANANSQDGDIVKSRDRFAIYDGYEWVGNLAAMNPGSGYIYKSNDNKKTFVYPTTISSNRGVVAEQKVDNLFASEYPNNMNVIAVVKDGDAVVENAAVEVYADNSLRCVSEQSVVDNKHFMTIYGDKSAERLTFNVVVDGIVYEVENTIDFSEDAVVGALDNPYIIQLNNDIPIDGINVYPTLVKDILNISSKENINNVSVYNVSGLEVYRGENYSESTQINLENLNSGTYFVKVMTENGNVKVSCVVKY